MQIWELSTINDVEVGDKVICTQSTLSERSGQIYEVVTYSKADVFKNLLTKGWLRSMELQGDTFELITDERFTYAVYQWES